MTDLYTAALESIRANSLLSMWLGALAISCMLSIYFSASIQSPTLRAGARAITLIIMLVVFIGLLLAPKL
jgi:hypothetical protein